MNIQLGLNKGFDTAKEIVYSFFPEKRVKIEEVDYKLRYFFNIHLLRNRSVKDFYDRIADLILSLILNIYSEDIINKYINDNLKEFKIDERKEIGEISKRFLLDKDNFIVEKQYIKNKIKNFIYENPFVFIDGFLKFRLKDIDLFMNSVVDKAVKEFTAKKEYKEFIDVLKYFIDIQQPKYNVVNLIFLDNSYILLDENNNIIDNNFFEDILFELKDNEISQDDLLISTLIILAPSNLIVHLDQQQKDTDIVKVLIDVFEDKVYFCFGCEKCKKEVKIKNS